MKHTVMIDLPSVMNGGTSIDAYLFNEILDILHGLKGLEVIYNEDVTIEYGSYDTMHVLIEALSRTATKPYSRDDEPKTRYLQIIPNLCDEKFGDDLNTEIRLQAYTLHLSQATLFLVAGYRWPDDMVNLRTVRDSKGKEHPTRLIDTANRDRLEEYLLSRQPKLDQHKHRNAGYYHGDRFVSPFSAYDPRDERAAKELLRHAYVLYMGEDIFPKYLYTWDSNHKTFVEFRITNQDTGTYHGFDCDRSNVPSDILALLHK